MSIGHAQSNQMTGIVQPPTASEPGAPDQRRALPPWHVVLVLAARLCQVHQFAIALLVRCAHADLRVQHFLPFDFIATFWFWPRAASADPKRSASPWLRWWSLAALVCFAAYALGTSATDPLSTRGWALLNDLIYGISGDRPQNTRGLALLAVVIYGSYSAALIYPFPRLFAELRPPR
jgi:hypothetical protein